MSSATGISDRAAGGQHSQDTEPLLGAPGDASQRPDKPIAYNFWLGTGVLAQFGIWIVSVPVRGAKKKNERY